nr:MAG TPA: Kinesin-like protein KIFC3, motor domain, adp, STRUCTURAL [Caudoviricetes sp.]
MYVIFKKIYAGNIPTEHYNNIAICGVYDSEKTAKEGMVKVFCRYRPEKKIHADWHKPNEQAEPSTTRINVIDWRRKRTPKYYCYEIEELNETNTNELLFEALNL